MTCETKIIYWSFMGERCQSVSVAVSASQTSSAKNGTEITKTTASKVSVRMERQTRPKTVCYGGECSEEKIKLIPISRQKPPPSIMSPLNTPFTRDFNYQILLLKWIQWWLCRNTTQLQDNLNCRQMPNAPKLHQEIFPSPWGNRARKHS